MAVRVQIPCPGCGLDRTPRFLGLSDDGRFVETEPRELQVHLHRFGGRGRIAIERQDMPVEFALGLRDMLRTRLAQLDEALAAAGVE